MSGGEDVQGSEKGKGFLQHAADTGRQGTTDTKGGKPIQTSSLPQKGGVEMLFSVHSCLFRSVVEKRSTRVNHRLTPNCIGKYDLRYRLMHFTTFDYIFRLPL